MSLHKKIKVVDLVTLELEKQRLKAICEIKQVKLEKELLYLKENYPEVAMKTLLPFNDNTNDLLFKSAKWINASVTDLVGDSNSKFGNFLGGKGGNMLQAALLYTFIRIGRNILKKKK
ncbi:MAG: hypothetical protein IPO83_02215 [Chitinophagaceae bacterium]|nr:hypothetical protein [Chitinophagaceae bacterium]